MYYILNWINIYTYKIAFIHMSHTCLEVQSPFSQQKLLHICCRSPSTKFFSFSPACTFMQKQTLSLLLDFMHSVVCHVTYYNINDYFTHNIIPCTFTQLWPPSQPHAPSLIPSHSATSTYSNLPTCISLYRNVCKMINTFISN